jgi:3-deoxy-D-manno-octulosonic-acid transferase
LAAWLGDPAARAAVVGAATETMDKLGGALERTLAVLDPDLRQLWLNGRATAAG